MSSIRVMLMKMNMSVEVWLLDIGRMFVFVRVGSRFVMKVNMIQNRIVFSVGLKIVVVFLSSSMVYRKNVSEVVQLLGMMVDGRMNMILLVVLMMLLIMSVCILQVKMFLLSECMVFLFLWMFLSIWFYGLCISDYMRRIVMVRRMMLNM